MGMLLLTVSGGLIALGFAQIVQIIKERRAQLLRAEMRAEHIVMAARLRASAVVRSTETLHASPAPVLGLSHDNRPTSDGTDTPTITTHENRSYLCFECGERVSGWPMCEPCVIENMQPAGGAQ